MFSPPRLQKVVELPPMSRGCHVITRRLLEQVGLLWLVWWPPVPAAVVWAWLVWWPPVPAAVVWAWPVCFGTHGLCYSCAAAAETC